MERLPNWRELLTKYIENSMNTPFVWGEHDCALWSATGLELMGHPDITSDFRGQYKTARGALGRMKRLGYACPHEIALARVGPTSPIAFAMAGDMVAADLPSLGLADPSEPSLGLSLGLCYGALSYFVGEEPSRSGLIEIPTLKLEHCYHV